MCANLPVFDGNFCIPESEGINVFDPDESAYQDSPGQSNETKEGKKKRRKVKDGPIQDADKKMKTFKKRKRGLIKKVCVH
jgi:hypothetical protein